MSPRRASCLSLTAFACQPISAMKIGMTGAATSSTRAATHDKAKTKPKMTSGTTAARMRSGWNLAR